MPVLTVHRGALQTRLSVSRGVTLLQAMQSGGCLPVEAPCGGKGTCGRCLVEVRGGVSAPSSREQELLSGGETKRLACLALVESDCEVFLPVREERIAAEGFGGEFPIDRGEGLGAAVDIGTTTVVLSLYDRRDGARLAVVSDRNAQRAFGADVISRIQYSMEQADGLERLTTVIRAQLNAMLDEACRSCGRARGEVTALFAAGNTVMLHLLAGLSPASIAVAPFTPQFLFGTWCDASELGFELAAGAKCYLAPCVSGYVGGDITAGLTAVRALEAQSPVLLVDVGTNGEMALGDRNGLTCCATAAGPAFEGANISCGMTAVDGAIHRVWVEEGRLRCQVLGGGETIGLCGSGLVDTLAALLALGVVDETGRLLPAEEAPEEFAGRLEGEGSGVRFRLTEQVWLTAEDVRKLQLAKAAVAAGIETLLLKTGVKAKDLSAFYLAGGFGSYLDPESAAAIGLFPAELLPKLVPVGNSAGAGIGAALRSGEARELLERTAQSCSYLELSGLAEFNERYIDCMMFE